MKLNEKLFDLSTGEPANKFVFENKSVEVHFYSDENGLINNYAQKGKFSFWSSKDGEHYKFYALKEYYDEVGDLYNDKCAEVWLKFWDEIGTHRKHSLSFLIPASVICLLVFIATSIWVPIEARTWCFLGVIGVLLFSSIFSSKLMNARIQKSNQAAMAELEKYNGTEKFEHLLDLHQSFARRYFKYDEEDNQEENGTEDNQEEIVENLEAKEENNDIQEESINEVETKEEENNE